MKYSILAEGPYRDVPRSGDRHCLALEFSEQDPRVHRFFVRSNGGGDLVAPAVPWLRVSVEQPGPEGSPTFLILVNPKFAPGEGHYLAELALGTEKLGVSMRLDKAAAPAPATAPPPAPAAPASGPQAVGSAPGAQALRGGGPSSAQAPRSDGSSGPTEPSMSRVALVAVVLVLFFGGIGLLAARSGGEASPAGQVAAQAVGTGAEAPASPARDVHGGRTPAPGPEPSPQLQLMTVRVDNRTSSKAFVSVRYLLPSGQWVTSGYYEIPPASGPSALEGVQTRNTVISLHAHNGSGVTWGRGEPEYYAVKGVQQPFFSKDTGNSWDWTWTLVEPGGGAGLGSADVDEPDTREVGRMIESWRQAWESQSFTTYMGFYHPEFRSLDKGMGLGEYRSYKAGLFRQYPWIRVSLGTPSIDLSAQGLVVRFRQDYRSPSYSDSGIKTLVLRREDSRWLIYREDFQMK